MLGNNQHFIIIHTIDRSMIIIVKLLSLSSSLILHKYYCIIAIKFDERGSYSITRRFNFLVKGTPSTR